MDIGDSFRSFDENGMIYGDRSAVGTRGMVSSGRAEASAVGREILKRGGNAVDAAVAVAFALGVCEPNANGIGGGGFILLRDGKTGKNVFIDFRETAPAAATPEMYDQDAPGSDVDIKLRNIYGGMAVATPGDVAGLTYALEHYGTMELADVIAPAAALARRGFVVTPLLHQDITEHREHLKQYGDGHKIYLKDGAPYPVGAILKNPALARTLELIAKDGAAAFYRGEIADRIVDQVKKDGGRLTHADLLNYRVRVLTPVSGSYRGYTLISSPPPSSGGTHVVEIMNVLENFDIAHLAVNGADYLHLFSEVFKLCYADRSRYMGDPNFVTVPLRGLLSKEYARTLAARVDMAKSTPPRFGEPFKYESPSTTHFSIGDASGNLAAVTRTINHFFGSDVMPEGTGFLLNDEMEDFSLDPASPNRVAPGKVPLSCMSPTFVLKDGAPFAVLGSPGGIRIISSVAQVISKLIDHGMTLPAAVGSPRIGDDVTDTVIYESRIPKDTVDELARRGHKLFAYPDWDRIMGSVNGVSYASDGTITGTADPRRDGLALGI